MELDGTPWLAHVVCHTWSRGDTAAVGFWLVREQVGAARKWSILGTDLARVAPGTPLYIDSKSHEYGFIDLLRIDDEGRPGVYPYIGPPGISALFELQEALLRGGLRILAIERVTMHLLQVPGWTLQVEYRPPPTGLGTTDLLLGAQYRSNRWTTALAYQHVLNQANKNAFSHEAWSGNTDAPGYFESYHLERANDLVGRLQYAYGCGRLALQPGVLAIYHLGTDSRIVYPQPSAWSNDMTPFRYEIRGIQRTNTEPHC